jgi:hypothetical protein
MVVVADGVTLNVKLLTRRHLAAFLFERSAILSREKINGHPMRVAVFA